MIFKRTFAVLVLLFVIYISFAIDGSLPIIPVENAVNPNAKGHTKQVNLNNDKVAEKQPSIQKSKLIQTNEPSNKEHLVISSTESNGNESTRDALIDDYDYDFKNDIEAKPDEYSLNLSKRESLGTITTNPFVSTVTSKSAISPNHASSDLLHKENTRQVSSETESTLSLETQKLSISHLADKKDIFKSYIISKFDDKPTDKVELKKRSRPSYGAQNTKYLTTNSLLSSSSPNLYGKYSSNSGTIVGWQKAELINNGAQADRPDTSDILKNKSNWPYKSSTQSTQPDIASSFTPDNDTNIESSTRRNIEQDSVNNNVNNSESPIPSTPTLSEYPGTEIVNENSNTNKNSRFSFGSKFSKHSTSSSLYQTDESYTQEANVSFGESTDSNLQHSTTNRRASYENISLTTSIVPRILQSKLSSSTRSINYWKPLAVQVNNTEFEEDISSNLNDYSDENNTTEYTSSNSDDLKKLDLSATTLSEYSDAHTRETTLPSDIEYKQQSQYTDRNTWYLQTEEENSTTPSNLGNRNPTLFTETNDFEPLLNDTNVLLTITSENPMAFANESEIFNESTSEMPNLSRNTVYSEKEDDPLVLLNTTPIHGSLVSNQSSTSASASASHTPLSQNTNTNLYSSSFKHENLDLIPHLSTKSIFASRKYSTRRIEISDKKTVNVYWECPPKSENIFSSFKWYKMSKDLKYETPLLSKTDTLTNRSVLEIQAANKNHEGRYFCVISKGGSLHSSKIYFYQIVILETKWINIGSENSVSLYHNQMGILNCPYGDIIKNNASLKGPCCSCRVTFQEHLSISNREVYRCSNSDKTTVKMEATKSSANCSLALNACDYKEDTYREIDATYNSSNRNVNNLEKCQFQFHFKRIIPLVSDKSTGNIYIRFFFVKSIGKCFPYETRDSQELYSFYSHRECEQSCVTISPDIEPCFHPKNSDTSDDCQSAKTKGTYKTSYDIDSNSCNWFYHCEESPLSKNVFKSISKCNSACVKNEKSIKLEAIKLCYQQEYINISVLSGDVKQRWVVNRKSQECHLVNIRAIYINNYFSFATKTKCERMCKVTSRQGICLSRPENGECTKRSLKWHFNINIKQCMRIFDGGCGDSQNRFDSKEACEEMCSEFIEKVSHVAPAIPNMTTINVSTIRPIIATQSKKRVTFSQKLIFRRRFNRKISDHELYRTTTLKDKVSMARVFKKDLDILDRQLDFDPCLENAVTGACDYGLDRESHNMIRYSFMPQTGRCYKIKFSGCKSGGNLFDDVNDCKAACEFRLYHSLKSPNCQNPYLQRCVAPNNAPNQTNLTRYFYLPLNSECVEFTSIDSNQCLHQYFTSSHHCKQICMPTVPIERMLQNRCFGKIIISEALCTADQKVYLWFYLSKIHQCLQYSTCEVAFEGNLFKTKLECEQTCKASNILTVCDLAVNHGSGNGTRRRYFFNSQLGKCQLFYYKGSLGNLNRFTTKDECKMACFYTMRKTGEIRASSLTFRADKFGDYRGTFTSEIWLNKVTDKEYCYDPHKYGSCDSNNPEVFVKKYYYDGYRKHCEPYMFSGCGSISRNSFDSMAICDKMCTERISKTVSSLCSQKVSKCLESNWIYWIYNSERGNCEPFASCIKASVDQFFFTSEKHCTQACVPVLPLKKDLFDICHLPPPTENCGVLTERWYYHELTESCLSFSGCEQFGNNFPSISSCMSACEPRNLKDVCQLSADKGPCNDNSTLRYHFDWGTQTCRLFSYGGCLGNRNKFQTKMECELVCLSRNRCNYKFNNDKCAYSHSNYPSNLFYYNFFVNKCVQLKTQFCGDDIQLFSSLDDCSQHCVVRDERHQIVWDIESESTKPLNPKCWESLKFNQYPLCLKSEEWLPRFFYDKHKSQCAFFYYNGCNGTEDHGNRFTNVSQCQAICENPNLTTTTVTSTTSFKERKSLNNKSKQASTKNGVCPAFNSACTRIGENSKRCLSDNDCPGLFKCCSCEMNHLISSLCMDPLGCMHTRNGCCADGLTPATSTDHQNCARHSAIIDQYLVETLKKTSDDDLILNCFVKGDPKPNITWIYFGNTTRAIQVDSKWDLIRPMWSGVAKIPIEQDSLGLWVCQARNEAGWDDKEIYVHSSEIELPIMQIHSLGGEDEILRTATLNSNILLHCPIYGVPRPNVTWFYNRIAVSHNFSSILYFNRYLEIRTVQFIHEGVWSCFARNKNKSLSHSIKLKILEPLQILPPPMGTRIKASHGRSVVLFCNVQAKGNHSINWYWETDRIRYKMNSTLGTDHRILNISKFRNPYLGKYICEANNAINKASIEFTIIPFASDDIVVNPSGTVFVGVIVVLTCPVKLSGDLDYVLWKKDHVHIKTKTTDLTVTLHSKSDSGFYSCQHNRATYLTYLLVNNKP